MTTLRWGILSTAKIGRTSVVPAIRASERGEVVAVASRDGQRARDFADEFSIPTSYGAYEDLLADPDIDAVYNPLPNHLHAPLSIAAARAGKHVLCEKPIALSAAEAEEMFDVFAAEDRVLMEAFMYRFHPQWEHVTQLAADGSIGQLRAINAWFSYNNTDPNNIRNVKEWGGGALMDIGCYCIDVARMLFDAEPVSVQGRLQIDPEFGTDTMASGVLDFERGHSTFTCATNTAVHQRVLAIGSEGRVEVALPFSPAKDGPAYLTLTRSTASGPEATEIEVPAADQYTRQVDAFTAAVLDGSPVPITRTNSLGTMRVIDAIAGRG